MADNLILKGKIDNMSGSNLSIGTRMSSNLKCSTPISYGTTLKDICRLDIKTFILYSLIREIK